MREMQMVLYKTADCTVRVASGAVRVLVLDTEMRERRLDDDRMKSRSGCAVGGPGVCDGDMCIGAHVSQTLSATAWADSFCSNRVWASYVLGHASSVGQLCDIVSRFLSNSNLVHSSFVRF